MTEYQPAIEGIWRRSRFFAQGKGGDIMLSGLESQVLLAAESNEVDDFTYSALFNGGSEPIDAEGLYDQAVRYGETDFYKNLTQAEKSRVDYVLSGDSKPLWLYGRPNANSVAAPDELIAGPGYKDVRQVGLIGRHVLSGMLGAELARVNPDLIKTAEAFSRSPLDRAVLLGGAAMLATTSIMDPLKLNEGVFWSRGFKDSIDDGEAMDMFVGGDINGDFRTSRLDYESFWSSDTSALSSTSSLSTRHYYAPALSLEHAAAYHSTEARIVRGLLTHLVVNRDHEPQVIVNDIYNILRDSMDNYKGGRFMEPFGDYGMRDGRVEALSTKSDIEGVYEKDDELASLIVLPGDHDTRLSMNPSESGVEMVPVEYDADGGLTKFESRAFHLDDDEIPRYVAMLAMGRGGRTSSRAVMRVVDSLKIANYNKY